MKPIPSHRFANQKQKILGLALLSALSLAAPVQDDNSISHVARAPVEDRLELLERRLASAELDTGFLEARHPLAAVQVSSIDQTLY